MPVVTVESIHAPNAKRRLARAYNLVLQAAEPGEEETKVEPQQPRSPRGDEHAC